MNKHQLQALKDRVLGVSPRERANQELAAAFAKLIDRAMFKALKESK